MAASTETPAAAAASDRVAAIDALADQYAKTHSWLFRSEDRQHMVPFASPQWPSEGPAHSGRPQPKSPQKQVQAESEQDAMAVDTHSGASAAHDCSWNISSGEYVFPRFVYCICTLDGSVLLYDTQFLCRPLAILHRLHLAPMTDCSWSADGRLLVCSSSDGYLTFVFFTEAELGQVLASPSASSSPRAPCRPAEQQATVIIPNKSDQGLQQQQRPTEAAAPVAESEVPTKPRMLVLGNARAKILKSAGTTAAPGAATSRPTTSFAAGPPPTPITTSDFSSSSKSAP